MVLAAIIQLTGKATVLQGCIITNSTIPIHLHVAILACGLRLGLGVGFGGGVS